MSCFEELRRANLARSQQFIAEWSPNDFMVAMIGEAGEAANLMKKMKRSEKPNAFTRPEEDGEDAQEEMRVQIGEELADVAIYLDLLAAKLGIDLWAEIVLKFNSTSRRIGSPERLTIA